MKASEVTEAGFYWWKFDDSPDCRIVEVTRDYRDTAWVFWAIGRDDESYANEMAGEFVGPLVPPTT